MKTKPHVIVEKQLFHAALLGLGYEKDARLRRGPLIEKKKKPAVRDAPTAGVELVDGLEPPTC